MRDEVARIKATLQDLGRLASKGEILTVSRKNHVKDAAAQP
jgi:hypothetical protein